MKKPRCKLIGQDGNVFNLIGIARRTLSRAGQDDKAKEMSESNVLWQLRRSPWHHPGVRRCRIDSRRVIESE
jgi:hypothetical protein